MDMQCGPLDRSLLVQQDEHISTLIWEGGDREKLDVRQYTTQQGVWELQADQRALLRTWGFGVFINPRSVPQNDIALIKTLVERWRPETNSFHFSFGEMTITLEDVYMIMGLPISGRALTHTELSDPIGYWINKWQDLRLHVHERKDMYADGGGGVRLCYLRERYKARNLMSPLSVLLRLRLVLLMHCTTLHSVSPLSILLRLRLVLLMHCRTLQPQIPLSVHDETTSPLMDTTSHTSRSFAFTPIPLKAFTSEETPSTERGVRPFMGFGSGSIPTRLKDIFDMDTTVDKMKDERDRGGLGNKGDLTRPLKNQKIRWLFRHWWTNDGEFIWQTHSQKGVTMSLTKEQLSTLKPGHWLEDSVVDAYVELLKTREDNLWNSGTLRPPAKRFFFASSWWMVIGERFCNDLKKPPKESIGDQKKAMESFIKSYQKQFCGPNLQDCDAAFFPVCHEHHWILFVANINKGKVLLIDPLRDDAYVTGKEVYPYQYYLMEKFLPFMLHKLKPERYPERYMRIKEAKDRPKQKGGIDCGVYVCKYMDAICNGISLKEAHWDPEKDVMTFRYRIAHELLIGEARLICDWGIRQRNLGF